MIKTEKTANFSDVFNFAGKRFNISWNEANDLFFNDVLRYKGFNRIFDCQSYTSLYEHPKDLKDFTDDEIKAIKDPRDKAYFILGKFLIEHNEQELLILND